jgi:cytochrome c556
MPPVSTGNAIMHAVHDEQLREVMKDLRSASFDRLPQELDDPSRERAYLQETSSRAEDLAHAADQIAAIVDQTGLTTNQQQIFLELAARLRDRALQLRNQAERRQTRLINTTMKEIDDTCASCHELFRTAPRPSTAGTP